MKHTFLLIICFVALSCTSAQSPPSGKANPSSAAQEKKIEGIFSFGLAKNFRNSGSFKLDYISGMTACFTWEDLEPQEGKYDFDQIDKQIDWATKNNKILNICLYAGNKSPSWLYSKNIPVITWKRKWKEDQAKARQSATETEKAPAFWEPTYLDYWKKFVKALAERYNSNPSIGYVSITGATPKDMSTGTVIRFDDDWQKIVDAGYTYQKHLKAWTSLTDYYVTVFPSKILVVALGPLRPGSSNLDLSRDLVNYIVDKKYQNVKFLCVILNDTWFESGGVSVNLRNLFKKGKENEHTFGYQMVYSAQRMDRFENSKNKLFQDFGETLKIAIDDGASWIEVWHDDIIDPKFKAEGKPNSKYESQIQKASIELKKSGNDK